MLRHNPVWLSGALMLASCLAADAEPDEGSFQVLDSTVRVDLATRITEAQDELERLRTALDGSGPESLAARPALDSLEREAARARVDLDELANRADEHMAREAEALGARIDSIERGVILVLFRTADDVGRFEARAEDRLEILARAMAEVRGRLRQAGEEVGPETRDHWAVLEGELTELEAESSAVAEAGRTDSPRGFLEARLAFARSTAALGREVRLFHRRLDTLRAGSPGR